MEDIIMLRSKAHNLAPVIRIGKNGLTDAMILEIIKVLKTQRLVKIKLLKAFIEDKDRKAIGPEIAAKTRSTLVQQTGFVVVLYK
jgi:RNA-binding protein